jgi:hypothetical protein
MATTPHVVAFLAQLRCRDNPTANRLAFAALGPSWAMAAAVGQWQKFQTFRRGRSSAALFAASTVGFSGLTASRASDGRHYANLLAGNYHLRYRCR